MIDPALSPACLATDDGAGFVCELIASGTGPGGGVSLGALTQPQRAVLEAGSVGELPAKSGEGEPAASAHVAVVSFQMLKD